MKTYTHNPNYKLIEVIINGNAFVLGQSNDGENLGLEIYYGGHNFYYSRRFLAGKVPAIYNELFNNLKSLLPKCNEGYKIDLEISDYKELAN